MAKKNKKKMTPKQKVYSIILAVAVVGICLFGVKEVFSFSDGSFISKWRTIYIETAMSTHSHQWLATLVLPRGEINAVLEKRDEQNRKQAMLESTWDASQLVTYDGLDGKEWFEACYWEINNEDTQKYLDKHPDVLKKGYENIKIVDMDKKLGLHTVKGDSLLVLDTANNIMIIEVKGDGYIGKMVFIKNPEQIKHVLSSTYGTRGEEIGTYGKEYGAVVAINCSAFKDVEGHGSGGEIRGSAIVDGVEYGLPNEWKVYAMTFDNVFYINNYYAEDVPNYRWSVQFFPALIVDGENVLESDSSGYGIQPRTCLGQAKDATFMMLTIDGRQAGYSLGATVGECEKILERYGAYQAGAIDGGSSTVLYYDGKLINSPSSVTGRGRFGPDSLIVIPADKVNGWKDTRSKFVPQS